MKIELTQRQAEKVEDYISKYNFSIDDYEIIYVPKPFILIRSLEAQTIIISFLKNKFNIKIK